MENADQAPSLPDENRPSRLRFIPYFSDYGFKVTFGTDSLFTRKALSVFMGETEPLSKLSLR